MCVCGTAVLFQTLGRGGEDELHILQMKEFAEHSGAINMWGLETQRTCIDLTLCLQRSQGLNSDCLVNLMFEIKQLKEYHSG